MSEQAAAYDAGPGRPLSGCGDGAVAMTAMGHYLAAERALARKRVNQDSPGALAALDGEAMLHYVASIAAGQMERQVTEGMRQESARRKLRDLERGDQSR